MPDKVIPMDSTVDNDVSVEVLYLVHGHVMKYTVVYPKNLYKFFFAPDCFDENGAWNQFEDWRNSIINNEKSLFPVDDGGYISVKEISAMWQCINGVEHGRPAWLDDTTDKADVPGSVVKMKR